MLILFFCFFVAGNLELLMAAFEAGVDVSDVGKNAALGGHVHVVPIIERTF